MRDLSNFKTIMPARKPMRNIKKTIDKGRKLIGKHPRMDLEVCEMQEFYDDFQKDKAQSEGDAVFNLMGKVFYFGVTVGYRIAKKQKKDS